MSVVLETTIGDITVDLYLKERPNACLNFLKLCRIKYYNLCIFHKVERNFIAQTGDPTSTGRGGESIFCHLYGEQAKYFDAELKPRLKHEKLGTLSMVNNGNSMNGSQFFLTLGENLTYLDEVHTVFGEVVEGFDVLLKINEAICDPNNRPYQDIRITHTVVLHDPYDDPSGLQIPDASPIPTKEQLESGYIGADEEIDDTKGKNVEEIEEKIKDSEAKARATILEMVGDLPDADVKPPENVLFICKLNPVTTSEDLEIIFSRFGTIVSCEVIKDKKSGESLQYAFIEFEKEEDCENAYFKMDNVLIDDRRIHVDFSQSVSKLNWEKEGKSRTKGFLKGQNFVIKGREKKSDGYDMIFDMDNNSASSRRDDRKHKMRSPDRREKRSVSLGRFNEKRNKSSTYSNQKHKKKNIEDNRNYSNRKSKYESSSVKSKNGRSLVRESMRHTSRSLSPYRKLTTKRSRHQKGSSDQSSSPERLSSKKHVRHDSSSSHHSISTVPTNSSHKKERYHTKPIETSKSSNNSLKQKLLITSPLAHHGKKIKRVTSSSTSGSSKSPSPLRKSSKQVLSHSVVYSKFPDPKNYKKKISKRDSTFSRSCTRSPEPSYRHKKTTKPVSSHFNSRSKSPESLSDRKRTKPKYSSSNQKDPSSPESSRDRRPDFSKLKNSDFHSKYEKEPKHSKSSKSKYSDESSDSNYKQSRDKLPKAYKSKSLHISRSSKHSHKEHKRRKRSSS